MGKLLKTIGVFVAVMFLLLVVFSGCLPKDDPEKADEKKSIQYFNYTFIEKDFSYDFYSFSSTQGLGSHHFRFTYGVTNKSNYKNPSQTNAEIVRVSTKVRYKISIHTSQPYLEPDFSTMITGIGEIPTSVQDEEYYLSYGTFKVLLIYYRDIDTNIYDLYYKFGDEIVNHEEITYGRTASEFIWISDDNIHGTKKWYLDPNYEKEYKGYSLHTNTTLYSPKESYILEYNTADNGVDLSISGIKLPLKDATAYAYGNFDGKHVYSINGPAFRSVSVKKVYIDNSIDLIGKDAISPSIENIYYKGTEEEWNLKNKSYIQKYVKIFFEVDF
jgi:hypothetical protein